MRDVSFKGEKIPQRVRDGREVFKRAVDILTL